MDNVRERRRQQSLAKSRASLSQEQFVRRLVESGIDAEVAVFVWDEVQPYYFRPLTPHPSDMLIGEFRIDGDDLSEMVVAFEKKFSRKWIGVWKGPDDPMLEDFARGLLASTEFR